MKNNDPDIARLFAEVREGRAEMQEMQAMLRLLLEQMKISAPQGSETQESAPKALSAVQTAPSPAPSPELTYPPVFADLFSGMPTEAFESAPTPDDDETEPHWFIGDENTDTEEEPEDSAVKKLREVERLHRKLGELCDSLPNTPVEAPGTTPPIEEYILEACCYGLVCVNEFEFRSLLRRDFPLCIVERYIDRTLSRDALAAIASYYNELDDATEEPLCWGLEEAAEQEEEEDRKRKLARPVGSLSDDELEELLKSRRAELSQVKAPALKPVVGDFRLRGRHALAQFLNEQVVDLVKSPESYAPFHVTFPLSFILEGDPGCGKTYAVERLAEFLGWNIMRATMAQLGSGVIHETSCKIEELFKEAAAKAPTLLIMDELDGLVPKRTPGDINTHVQEEVGSFLKCMQEAPANRVLVVGMTNLIGSIDYALLRNGRLGTHLHVEMPDAEEVEEVLTDELATIPHTDFPQDAYVQRLVGCPMADIARVVKEASMHAARARRKVVTEDDMDAAFERIEKCRITDKKERTPIGFIS